jgi:MFS family permease
MAVRSVTENGGSADESITAETDRQHVGAAGTEAPFPAARTAWYTVGILSLVNALDNIDRGIISILIEPIKRDLQLTDTQMSVLIGIAFSSFYAVVGLGAARLADVATRKYILSFGIGLWSLATACGSLAQGFLGLFASRALTGAGESLKGPNALSMISDLVPRKMYPRAMSLYQFGITLGAALSLIIGGTLMGIVGGRTFAMPFGVELRDWQFILLLILFTVPEPVRRGREKTSKPTYGEFFSFLKREKAIYIPFLLGSALLQIEAIGLITWRVPFFARAYGWGPEQIGPIAGIMGIVITPIGLILGAWLGERMSTRDNPGALVKLTILGTCLSLPFAIAALLAADPWTSLAFSALNYTVIGIGAPAATAALQVVTPNEYRGQISAIYLFTISVIGTGLGPLAVALFTDYVFGNEADLYLALIAVVGGFGLVGLVVKWSGLKAYSRRVEAIYQAEDRAEDRLAAA